MSAGVLQQIDTPQRLYDEPANVFVAGFMGTPPMNLLVGRVANDGGSVSVTLGGQAVVLPDAALDRYAKVAGYAGREIVVGVRADDLHPASTHPGLPTIRAGLVNMEALGSETICYFHVEAETIGVVEEGEEPVTAGAESIVAARPNLVASFPPRVFPRIGEEVEIAVDATNLHFFDQETGAALRS
jgi:multiple sugar transport system ATP-binding protein